MQIRPLEIEIGPPLRNSVIIYMLLLCLVDRLIFVTKYNTNAVNKIFQASRKKK